jgi:hypothetical protein
MNAQTPAIEAPVSIRALARETLRECDGKTKDAIDLLTKKLASDKRLMREVVADAVVIASTELIEGAMRHTREAVTYSASQARAGVVALANGIKFAILDFPLAGGVKLRDATPAQVKEQIDRYDAIGRDVLHKARWLRLVAKATGHNQRVGDALDDDRAQHLWNEASK